MNKELIEALKMLEKERGIEAEVLFEAIEESLVSAYKREFEAKTTDNIRAEIDRTTGDMRVFLQKSVVAEVEDANAEMSLADAKALSEDFEIGDIMEFQLSPRDFGRLAAQTAKSVINQRLSQAEKERIHNEFSDRIGEIAAGVVQRKDRREVTVDIGRAEAVCPYDQQSRLDGYNFNQMLRFLILRVDERRGRPIVIVSRSDRNLVRRLFEQEVPEIITGVVDIVAIAREAGSRTKMAVQSRDPNVDAVGSCVGQRGLRVQAVIDELMGEKIDIIEWDPDPAIFISHALSPSKVVRVDLNEEMNSAVVVVPDHQLSRAIGREGQNARLAAKLTGWKIDIKSESQYRELLEYELMSRFDQAVEAVEGGYIDEGLDYDDEDIDYADDVEYAGVDYVDGQDDDIDENADYVEEVGAAFQALLEMSEGEVNDQGGEEA